MKMRGLLWPSEVNPAQTIMRPVLQGEAVDVFGQKLVVLGVVDGLDGKKFFIHLNFRGSACQPAKFTPNLRRDFVL